MEHKQGSRIWKTTHEVYGVLILAYLNILDEMTEPVWSKHTQKCLALSAKDIRATVYHMIHDSSIEVDWEFLLADKGVDKARVRKMEMDWLTPTSYHHRIGAYPSN